MLLQYVAYSFPTEPRFLGRPVPRPPPAIPVLHFAQRLSHLFVLHRYATASPGTRLSSSAALASLRVRSAARGHFGKAPSAPSPNPWPISRSSPAPDHHSASFIRRAATGWSRSTPLRVGQEAQRRATNCPLTPGRSALKCASAEFAVRQR
jgi:hypothetical protein